MEAVDGHTSANPGNTLRVDLPPLKAGCQADGHDESPLALQQEVKPPYSSPGRHGALRNDPLSTAPDAAASEEGPAVDLLKYALGVESHGTENGVSDVYQLPHNTGVAHVSDITSHNSNTNAEDNGANHNRRRTSNSSLTNAANSDTNCRSPNIPDKPKFQVTEVSLPNNCPDLLGEPPRKSAISPFQKIEPRTAARRVTAGGEKRIKSSSFSASTNIPVRHRTARGTLAADIVAARTAGIALERPLNIQGLAKCDGPTGTLVVTGNTSTSGASAHQTDKGKEQREDVQGVQQENLVEGRRSEASDESEEDEDDEGQSESGETASCDADSQDRLPSEQHLEREDECRQHQETPEACPAVVETELGGPEEDEHIDSGELRYNMRTGKFTKAYLMRGSGHTGDRTLLKQHRTTVGSEKGSESSWIFPWEVRPDVDVFAAAAAATAASSARQQQVLPSRRIGSAPADSNSGGYASAGRAWGKRTADGLCRQKQPYTTHFHGRGMEQDKLGDVVISERQKETVFDCLSKMAQANEWAQMMKLDRNYRAFKTRDGKLACHVYQGKSYVKRLPMEVFMSYEHPRLRRRFMLCCPYLHVQLQPVAGTNLNDTEVRMRRELELQNVLLSTIHLTHELREQLDFLQRAASEHPPTQLR